MNTCIPALSKTSEPDVRWSSSQQAPKPTCRTAATSASTTAGGPVILNNPVLKLAVPPIPKSKTAPAKR